MSDHVHERSPRDLSTAAMRRHLRIEHGLGTPMTWDDDKLHEAHLKAHQTPEEAPVAEHPHEHGDIARFHETTDRRSVAYHLDEAHNIPREAIDAREIYSQHASLHPMKSETEVRTFIGDQEITDLVAVDTPRKATGDEQVMRDRLICAMAGVDFDRDWAADSGMGPSGRDALRQAYRSPANRLLDWIQRGGILEIEPVRQLARDYDEARGALQQTTEERDTVIEQLAVTGRQLTEAKAERNLLREDKARLKAGLEESERRRTGLFEELGEVRAELEQCANGRQRNIGAIDALEAELEETRQRLGAALEAGSILERQRDEAQAELAELKGRWDRVVPHLEARLIGRTQALANGQAALGELLSDLKRDGWDESTVFQRLELILKGVVPHAPVDPAITIPRLDFATTGELIEETRRRIDLGHCGLGYRPADEEF